MFALRKPCGKPSKIEVKGQHYCGIHDPVKRQKKRAEKYAAWEAASAARSKRMKLEGAAEQLAEAAQKALRECSDLIGTEAGDALEAALIAAGIEP
jgi:hypothetical protein